MPAAVVPDGGFSQKYAVGDEINTPCFSCSCQEYCFVFVGTTMYGVLANQLAAWECKRVDS